MTANPSRSSPPEPPILQDEPAAAQSIQVPDWFARAATTSTTEAAKPIHHITSLVTRTSSPAALVASVPWVSFQGRLLVKERMPRCHLGRSGQSATHATHDQRSWESAPHRPAAGLPRDAAPRSHTRAEPASSPERSQGLQTHR